VKKQNHKEMLSADFETSARHKWVRVQLTDVEKHPGSYNEKKFICQHCGCEKHTSTTYVHGSPVGHVAYWRGGINFETSPDCWGGKQPK